MINRLNELVAVNRAIVSSLDYDEVLRLIVEKTAAFTHADACMLLLVGPDDIARVAASHGLASDRTKEFAARFDERISDQIRALLEFREQDVFIGVPVIDRHHIRGILAVYRRGPEALREEDSSLVAALADQAVIALRHAHEYREVVQASQQKSRLLDAIQSTTTTYLAYLDCDLRFREVNAAFCTAVGRDPTDLIGHAYGEAFPQAKDAERLLASVCRSGKHADLHEVPRRMLCGASVGDDPIYWDVTAHPVLNEVRMVDGIVLSAVDVTLKVSARAELEAASRRKDEFLAMLAHELRNPLAAISSAVDVLRLSLADNPILTRASNAAKRQVSHMTRLLDDLLDVTRITSGKIELRRQRVDLAAVVGQAVQSHVHLPPATHHQPAIVLALDPVFVDGDPDRLMQVSANLLTNATKYNHPGGHVWVTTRRVGDEAVLSVRDDGIGIAPEALPRVFDLFAQMDRALDRAQGGLGIGLTIVKRLVEMHGGRVEAHSEGSGRGSEFVVRLPTALAAPSPGVEAETTTIQPPSPSPGRRILVAEDNSDTAEMLTVLLELEGHRVTVVNDGEAAVDAAVRDRPEVVLLDIGLPRLDGYEVARRIRGAMKGASPLLVALTGYGRTKDRLRSQQAGIDHHLVKPVAAEQLRRLLASP